MSRLHQALEHIGYLKFRLAVVIAICISLYSWLFTGWSDAPEFYRVAGLVGAVAVTITAGWLNMRIQKAIGALKDL